MHFSLIITSVVAIATAGIAGALEYRAYSSTTSCGGSWFGCTTNGSVCCGPIPAGWGYSAQFYNLASGTQGKGYGDAGCLASTARFQLFGPGTNCWNGGGTHVRSLKWLRNSNSGNHVDASADRDDVATTTEEGCVAPDRFEYEDARGRKRTINIPRSANATDVVAQLYASKKWVALEKYELIGLPVEKAPHV